jgi:cation:H+ antiporter
MDNDANESSKAGVSARLSVRVAIASVLALLVSGLLATVVGGPVWNVLFLTSQATVISIIIWQACDPFADAAQWIGTTLRLPGSVRGATLDAIASSMPELFTGVFFVVLALLGNDLSQAELAEAGGEGYGATVATCAGSAVYNMILIPAICALVISYLRPQHPTIDIEDTVISRDGFWFVGCEIVLLCFLFQDAMHWWMAVVLLLMYVFYLYVLFNDARRYQAQLGVIRHAVAAGKNNDRIVAEGAARQMKLSRDLIQKIRDAQETDASADELPESAGVLFGCFHIPLNRTSAWGVVAMSTLAAAIACYWLVEVTKATADQMNVPIFFVAVILAAAASSVPDTFLSVGAAMRGDDDGAVSNAFGSNVFDICVCLSIPLLVGSYLNGWQPMTLTHEGETMPGLVGLRILLCGLTIITLLIMWHNRRLTRRKAIVLCGLYGIFVAYAVAGSLGFQF